MSTALVTMPESELVQNQTYIDDRMLEAVVAKGDLSLLNNSQRVMWYRARCEAAGLDYRTQPFEYIVLKGKLKLYATKTATDQLIKIHKISVKILDRSYEEESGIYEVHCSAEMPDGRTGEDIGALFIKGMKGEDLANARMKTVTKAKRRTVLSTCGLGMLDETEVETIKGVRRVKVVEGEIIDGEVVDSHVSGDGDREGHDQHPVPSGQPRPQNKGLSTKESLERTKEFLAYLREECDGFQKRWVDMWDKRFHRALDDGKEVPSKVPELINGFQAKNHLLKWAKETGCLHPDADQSSTRSREAEAYLAAIFHGGEAEQMALIQELGDYIGKERKRLTNAIYGRHPELAPAGHFEEQAEAENQGDAYEGPEPPEEALPN